jgi:ketosteroid isomerase-like protein
MLAAAFFVTCMGVLTFAQQGASTGASDSAGTEQQVKQSEQQIRDSVLKGDTSALEQYLADDYIGINPLGMLVDKNQTLQSIKTGKVKYSSITVKEERVRTYGDTAIYNGLAAAKVTLNGQDQSGDYRVTIVWIKQNGQWKRVSYQSTRVQTQMVKMDE